MKFRLLDKDGKDAVHSGVMARLEPSQSVSWGSRVFVRVTWGDPADGVDYRELDNFRIGR